MMQNIKDGYKEFFAYFEISEERFLEFAKHAIISIPQEKAVQEWEKLKECLQSKDQKVFVRSYGRNGSGNSLYSAFYRSHFTAQIEIDKINNAEPTKMIQELTGFYKVGAEKKRNLQNYQVSHIFGKTKNPYAFCAPWNVAFLPKVLDPFTGQESKGELTTKITEMYREMMFQKYGDLISDFNQCMSELDEQIQTYIKENASEDRKIVDFHKSLKDEFSIISR